MDRPAPPFSTAVNNKLVDQIHADPDFPDWAKKIKAQHVLDGIEAIEAIEAASTQPDLIRFAKK